MPDRAEPSSLPLLRELLDAARRAEAEGCGDVAELSELDERLHDAWGESIDEVDLDSDLSIDVRVALAMIDRRLAAAEPDETIHAECLADHMESAAGSLATRGRLDEAEAAIREAREIRQRLFDAAPYNAELHEALAELLSVVADIAALRGDRPAALRAFDEAVAAAREVVEASPADDDLIDSLAAVLWDLGIFLKDGGDLPAAEASYREAAETYARVPAHDQARRWELSCLDELGDVLVKAGRKDDALAAYERSLGLARVRSADDPADVEALGDLAEALEAVGDARAALDNPRGARSSYIEALGVRRALAESDPGDHRLRHTANDLMVIGDIDVEIADPSAALRAYGEALELHRGLAARAPADPEAALDLRQTSKYWAFASEQAGKLDDAVRERHAQVVRSRGRADAAGADESARANLGFDLRYLGIVLARRGEHADAAAAFAESAAIRRPLVAAHPDDLDAAEGLMLVLGELRDAQVEIGATEEAIASARDAVAATRRHTELTGNAAEARRELAVDLDALGDLLTESSDHDGADAAHAEAELIFRALVADDPSRLRERDDLAICVGRRSRLRLETGDAAAALVLTDEAEAIHRALVAADAATPDRCRGLGNELRHRCEVLNALQDFGGALAAAEEALALFRGCSGLIERGDDFLRSALEEAADAASAAGRPDRAAELRAELAP